MAGLTTLKALGPRLPALLFAQAGLSAVLAGLSAWFHQAPPGTLGAVGIFLAAQTLGGIWEFQRPGSVRPQRWPLSAASATGLIALATLYFLVFGFARAGGLHPDPKKVALLAGFILPVSWGFCAGSTWLGLSAGCHLSETSRRRAQERSKGPHPPHQ